MSEPHHVLPIPSSWCNDTQTTSAMSTLNKKSNATATHFSLVETDVSFSDLNNDVVSGIIDKLESLTRQRLFLTSKAISCCVKMNTYSLNFGHMFVKNWCSYGWLDTSYIEDTLDRILNSTNFDKVRVIRINVGGTFTLPPHAIIENLSHKFICLFKHHMEWIINIDCVNIKKQKRIFSYMLSHPVSIETKMQMKATYDYFQAIGHHYKLTHQGTDHPLEVHSTSVYKDLRRINPDVKLSRSSDLLNINKDICREYKTKVSFYTVRLTDVSTVLITSRLRAQLFFLAHTNPHVGDDPNAFPIKHSIKYTSNSKDFIFRAKVRFMSKHAKDFKVDSICLPYDIDSPNMVSSMTSWIDASTVTKLITFETSMTIHRLVDLAILIKRFVNIVTIKFANLDRVCWLFEYCMSNTKIGIKHKCSICEDAMARFINKVGYVHYLTTREKIDEAFNIIHEAMALHDGKEIVQ